MKQARTRVAAVVSATLVALAVPVPAQAHGLGGRTDLPVPVAYFVVAAGVVLILSFAALAVLWPHPRYQTEPPLRPVPVLVPAVGFLTTTLRIVGVAALALVVSAGALGVDNASRNPAPVIVWVMFWLVVPFLAPLVGNIYRFINPWNTLSDWLELDRTETPAPIRRLGTWPAAVLLVAFTWLELVYPESSSPRVVAIAALVYTALMLVASHWAGRDYTFTNIDAFAIYNRLLAGISPFTLVDRRPARRPWLHALAHTPADRGLDWYLIAMIGTVSFDGLSGTTWYQDTFGDAGQATIGSTVGLLAMIGIVGTGYQLACLWAARHGGTPRPMVASRFAHTLVPIAFAYAFAHYFTLILFEGQLLITTVSDPFGRGWDLFGNAGTPIDYSLISGGTNWVWYVQLTAIVAGHVAGVILAHDRALVDFPLPGAVRSQYAMLTLMVALTALGLAILAAG